MYYFSRGQNFIFSSDSILVLNERASVRANNGRTEESSRFFFNILPHMAFSQSQTHRNVASHEAMPRASKIRSSETQVCLKVGSCAALLLFSVAATLFTEASKSADGTYPFNSFMIPCTVEAIKFLASTCLLLLQKIWGGDVVMSFTLRKVAHFSLPALCYFISNNCMFFIIRDLGPTTFQITNNLKVLATGVLMRLFLGKKLTWLRWKALVLLVIGSTVTQLESETSSEEKSNKVGFIFVLINSLAAGAGGVISEKLLKGKGESVVDSIHWQNMQLYFFGFLFGLGSMCNSQVDVDGRFFEGFNAWAYATIASLAVAGLLVSFILKYLDNFAKCFVAALSIVLVAVVHSLIRQEPIRLKLVIGIILTCMALEQYNLPQ